MPRFVALLRGINVGGRNTIPMRDLRTLCLDLGWADVRTYIQSGNVIFHAEAAASALEDQLERAIKRIFGFAVPVLVRPNGAWPVYLEGNPFPQECEAEPNLVLLALSKRPPNPAAVAELSQRAENGEQVAQIGEALWIHYPSGAGRSKLSPGLLDRLVGSSVATRNWRTVLKIHELACGE